MSGSWSEPQVRAPELRIAASALRFLALLGVPVLALCWLAAGPSGLLGGAIAFALVAGLFAMSGVFQAAAARISPAAVMGAALGGFALRLMLYTLLLVLLTPVETIHGPSLAVSAAVLMLATLAWEVRQVLRDPRFFWIDTTTPSASRPKLERTRA